MTKWLPTLREQANRAGPSVHL